MMRYKVLRNKLVITKAELNPEKNVDTKYDSHILKEIANEQTYCFEIILKLRQLLDHSPYPYNFSLKHGGLDEVNASELSRELYLLHNVYAPMDAKNRAQIFLNENKDIVSYFSGVDLYKKSLNDINTLLEHESSKYIKKFSVEHKYHYYLDYSWKLIQDFQYGRKSD